MKFISINMMLDIDDGVPDFVALNLTRDFLTSLPLSHTRNLPLINGTITNKPLDHDGLTQLVCRALELQGET